MRGEAGTAPPRRPLFSAEGVKEARRARGTEIPYWDYIKLGVPVTLAAITLSILALHAEVALYFALR